MKNKSSHFKIPTYLNFLIPEIPKCAIPSSRLLPINRKFPPGRSAQLETLPLLDFVIISSVWISALRLCLLKADSYIGLTSPVGVPGILAIKIKSF